MYKIVYLICIILVFSQSVDAQRGMAFQQSASLSNYIWNAPAGAGVSIAGAEWNRNHQYKEPTKTLIYNGCKHGVCESNVYM
jgi:hypothetical protein